jgi:hypothetical protein
MMRQMMLGIMALTGILIFSGCTASSNPVVPQTEDFTLGMQDGCATAKGEYSKDSEMFRANNEYHEGWFYGRKKCNPSDVKE